MSALVVLLFMAMLIGLIPATIAQSKGRSFIVFWLYGTLFFIVALPHALLMRTTKKKAEADAVADGGKVCPNCAEVIRAAASVCRFCGREVPKGQP